MTWDYKQRDVDIQAQADPAWELERFLNYGTENKKLDRATLEKYLPLIKIPQQTRDFLTLILWNKKY